MQSGTEFEVADEPRKRPDAAANDAAERQSMQGARILQSDAAEGPPQPSALSSMEPATSAIKLEDTDHPDRPSVIPDSSAPFGLISIRPREIRIAAQHAPQPPLSHEEGAPNPRPDALAAHAKAVPTHP